MSRAKIAITVDEKLLSRIDQLVEEQRFSNRSRAVEEALEEKLKRMDRNRLARECAKLDVEFEQQLAEEGMSIEGEEWPEY